MLSDAFQDLMLGTKHSMSFNVCSTVSTTQCVFQYQNHADEFGCAQAPSMGSLNMPLVRPLLGASLPYRIKHGITPPSACQSIRHLHSFWSSKFVDNCG